MQDWLNCDKPAMFALVLTPTRELAAQIEQQFSLIGASFGLQTMLLTGADDMSDQMVQLGKWTTHVVIGLTRSSGALSPSPFSDSRTHRRAAGQVAARQDDAGDDR